MEADPPTTPVFTYFLNGKTLAGAIGQLYGSFAPGSGRNFFPISRLVVRLSVPRTHHEVLRHLFEIKKPVSFEIHRGLHVELSVMATLSLLEKKGQRSVCLVEFAPMEGVAAVENGS